MEANFIKKGESKEFMLTQEIADVHGVFAGTSSVNALGGVIGQMVIVLSAAAKLFPEKVETFSAERKTVCSFIANYLS